VNAKAVAIEGVCTPPVINSVDVTQPSCETAGGTIVVNAAGDGDLDYSVNGGGNWQQNNTFSGLTPGDYNIRVRLRDNAACVSGYANNPVTIIDAPSAPVINAPGVTQPTCAAPTGTIVVNTAGNGAFDYSVNGGETWQDNSAFSGLTPGEYNIQVRLQNNQACLSEYANNPVIINNVPTAPVVSAPAVTQPTCAVPTGTIVVNTAGNGAFDYSVDDGGSWQDNNTFSDLAPGEYNIQVRLESDPTCATAYGDNPVILNNTSAPVITAPTVTQPACGEAAGGTIVVNATGPGDLDYSVDGGGNWQQNNTFSGLTPGEYNIQVRLRNDQACVSIYDANPIIIENLSATLATSICPADAMTFPQGDPGLDLSFVVRNNDPVTQHTFNVVDEDPEMDYVYWSNDRTTCILNTNFPRPNHQVFTFMVDQAGAYDFSFGTEIYRTVHIYSDPFDPDDGCMNFMGSSEDEDFYYDGILGAIALEACTIYHLIGTDASGEGNTTVSFTGPGSVYPVATLPGNTAYTYVAVNTANSEVAAVNPGADFTSLVAGSYQIFGANYYSGAGPDPAPVDPVAWIGQTIAQILNGGDCVTFSTNAKAVVVEGICTPPVVGAPTVTQPTAGVPTGTIVVNATGAGALDYSIDNGNTWFESNTFSGLVPDEYDIQVRLRDVPDCIGVYDNNPVVINDIPPPGLLVSAVVYLQGAYIDAGAMRDNLRTSGLLPLTEPYTDLGYQHIDGGGENIQPAVLDISGTNAIVDWVFLELRDNADLAAVIATRSALLQADGDVVDVDGVSPVTFADLPVDDYYLVVKHRNHLGVMSAAPVALSGTTTVVDFTSDLNQVQGAANGIAVLPDGKLGMYSGDFNRNGQVQNTDYANMVLTLGTAGYRPGDFDLNGQVQNTDLQLKLLPNIGRGAAFP
jgi:hypothetical protein